MMGLFGHVHRIEVGVSYYVTNITKHKYLARDKSNNHQYIAMKNMKANPITKSTVSLQQATN